MSKHAESPSWILKIEGRHADLPEFLQVSGAECAPRDRSAQPPLRSLRRLPTDEDGPITLLGLFFGLLLFASISMVWNTGQVTQKKIQVQTAADSAAHASALWMSRGLNVMAASNMHVLRDATAVGMAYQIELYAHWVSLVHFFYCFSADLPEAINKSIDEAQDFLDSLNPFGPNPVQIPKIPEEVVGSALGGPGAYAWAYDHRAKYRGEIDRIRKAANLEPYVVKAFPISNPFTFASTVLGIIADPLSILGVIGDLSPGFGIFNFLEAAIKAEGPPVKWFQDPKHNLEDHMQKIKELQKNVHESIPLLIGEHVASLEDYYDIDIDVQLGRGEPKSVLASSPNPNWDTDVQAPIVPIHQEVTAGMVADTLKTIVWDIQMKINTMQYTVPVEVVLNFDKLFTDPGMFFNAVFGINDLQNAVQEVANNVLKPAAIPYVLRFFYECYGDGSWYEDGSVDPQGTIEHQGQDIAGIAAMYVTPKAYKYLSVVGLLMGYLRIYDKHATIRNSWTMLEFGPFATIPTNIDLTEVFSKIDQVGKPRWAPYTVVAVARARRSNHPLDPAAPNQPDDSRTPPYFTMARGLFKGSQDVQPVAYAQAETFNGIDGFLDTFKVGGSNLLGLLYSVYPWRVWTTWGMQWQPRLTHGNLVPGEMVLDHRSGDPMDLGGVDIDEVALH